MQILINGVVIGFCVLFVWQCFQPDMIFERIGVWAEKNLPVYLFNPLFGCPICMSVWIGGGLYVFGVVSGCLRQDSWYDLPFTLFVAGGLNTALMVLRPD